MRRMRAWPALLVALGALMLAPTSSDAASGLPWVHAVRGNDARFADSAGREVLFHGVNVAQLNEYATYNSHPPDAPPLTQDDFRQMRALGLNNVRLLIAWSRLEPQPGQISATYLDAIAQSVQWAADEGIYVVIDMHQDAFSPFVKAPPGTLCPPGAEPQRGWDGAPAWATITDGMPACAPSGVRDFSPNTIQAFTNLWADRAAPDGIGIQTHLVAAWGALAAHFAGDPAVAGYDLLNEPHPGHLPDGDAATITRFYDEAIAQIRAVDKRHIIFVEPEVTRSAVSDVVIVPSPRSGDQNLAYAPHDYGDLAFGTAQDREFTNAEREASEAGGTGGALPIWFGEFPMLDKPDGGKAYNSSWQQLAAKHIVGWSHWVWKETCGNPHTGYGPVPPSTVIAYDCANDRFTSVKANRVPYLSSPYPAFSPGRLTEFAFDPATRRLRLMATGADPGAVAPLELMLPSAHFGTDPRGVEVTSSGLTALAVTRRDDGNLVLVARAAATRWTLSVTPTGASLTPIGRAPCSSRRLVVLRMNGLRPGMTSLRATANGRRVPVRLLDRHHVRVSLRGLARGRYRVTVVATPPGGKRVRKSRRFRVCAATRST